METTGNTGLGQKGADGDKKRTTEKTGRAGSERDVVCIKRERGGKRMV